MRTLGKDAGIVRSLAVLLAVLGLMIVVGGILFVLRSEELQEATNVPETVTLELKRAADSVKDVSVDALTTAKVKTALAVSKSVQAFDVDVDSEDGTVTLTGSVPSEDVERAALEIARDTVGVTDVVDRLSVGAVSDLGNDAGKLTDRLADAELRALIYERFAHAHDIDARRIDVVVVDRVATLVGAVERPLDRDRAEAMAATVQGLDFVVNELDVVDGFPRSTSVPIADENVAAAVIDELRREPGIDSSRMTVQASSGVVTLGGIASSLAEKRLAEMLAGCVEGVVEVVDAMEVG